MDAENTTIKKDYGFLVVKYDFYIAIMYNLKHRDSFGKEKLKK